MVKYDPVPKTANPGEDEEWSGEVTDGLLGPVEKQNSRRKGNSWLYGKNALKIHAAVFAIYIATVLVLSFALWHTWKKLDRQILYSPANEAIDWSVQDFNSGNGLHGNFIGPPRPALETAWAQLLGPMNVRLKLDDVKAFGREQNAVALSDGSGYAGSLNVYHELHCVRWLHKFVYHEEYWPNASTEIREKNRSHSNHCLNTLRKFAMCHGDVGLVIYSWQSDTLKPGANGTSHQCVDWPRLSSWAEEKAFDMYKPGLIVHPKLGPVYDENGKPNDVDAAHESERH